jgi:hypothetical protein
MQSLSLAQIFGEGAFQDANVLVIQKASFLKLTPLSNNTAESLLIAILITALVNFRGAITDENNQVITDENDQQIYFDNSEAFELIKMINWSPFGLMRNNQPYINHQIIVEAYDPN